MRFTGAIVLAAALATVAGCGGDSFAQRDPNGYEACSLLAESYKAGDIETVVNSRLEAQRVAGKSSTQAIQDSVGSSETMDEESAEILAEAGIPIGDIKNLIAACEDEGFNIPDEDKN